MTGRGNKRKARREREGEEEIFPRSPDRYSGSIKKATAKAGRKRDKTDDAPKNEEQLTSGM